jgi:cyclic pyranopterin phosphate synthase
VDIADLAAGVAPAAALSPGPVTVTPPPPVDRLGRRLEYLRVSVTDRCNYRCTYCLPADGVTHADRADVLSFEEIAALVGCFVRLGVRRVRLTGGEPTVRRDLPQLVAMLRAISGLDDLALSTNGHLLGPLAPALRQAGLDRLNVSLDTLDPARFASITRGGDLGRVLAGIAAAQAVGFPVKLNVVAVRGFNDDEVGRLGAYAWERGMVARFIEQMPMADGALFVPGTFMSAREIRDAIAAANPGAELVAEPPSPAAGAGPARYWRVTGLPAAAAGAGMGAGAGAGAAGMGRFGIISPLTEHFCDLCNRVRLSAAGALHPCLAHDEAIDLRAALREGGEERVAEQVIAALAGKRDGHTFGLLGIGGPRKAMIQIGG